MCQRAKKKGSFLLTTDMVWISQKRKKKIETLELRLRLYSNFDGLKNNNKLKSKFDFFFSSSRNPSQF
jgi:hypothetical protein